jgi:hypothetical protein
MPGLTVTEKEHWKGRIARRIDKQIDTLTAADPHLLERIEREAGQQALESLGLRDLQQQIDAHEQQQAELGRRQEQLHGSLLARVRGVPPESITKPYHSYQHEREVASAIKRRQSVHEDELLARSDLGREILRLWLEQENLLDTVWLATSSRDVRDLWQKVSELLGESVSPLQQQALAIPPAATADDRP